MFKQLGNIKKNMELLDKKIVSATSGAGMVSVKMTLSGKMTAIDFNIQEDFFKNSENVESAMKTISELVLDAHKKCRDKIQESIQWEFGEMSALQETDGSV
jgi:DNA-binding protein YbaB